MSVKNEVKINKISEEIREELSLALNMWQDIETIIANPNKSKENETPAPKPEKKIKLLKVIQQQLKTLSL